jgi:hypothetical protein
LFSRPTSETASVTMALLLSPSVAGVYDAHASRTCTDVSRSTFSNAQVEVKDDAASDSLRISVLPPGSHIQSQETAVSSPESPASLDSPKKGTKVSRPANAFILYRKHNHPDIVARNPGLHNNEVCKFFLLRTLNPHGRPTYS